MNRTEFIARFNEIMRHHGGGCEKDDHPLWEAEKADTPRIKCKWFVCVKPLRMRSTDTSKSDYWYWVTNTLKGRVTCYSSDHDNNEEWWGFQYKKDMTMWVLKWSK